MWMSEEAYNEYMDEANYQMNAAYDDVRERYGDTGDCGEDDYEDPDNLVGGVSTATAANTLSRALYDLACYCDPLPF